MNEFLVGVAIGMIVLTAVAVGGYFVARRLFERAAHRVADDIGRVLAEMSGRAAATPVGQRVGETVRRATSGRLTNLGAYAAAAGISEEAARREFAESVERLGRIMDAAVRLPIIGPVGLDAVIGLFPFVGDAVSSTVSLTLIARSIKYGIPREIIVRMLANVLVDALMGAVPVVGDLADMWFRANLRNVALLRDYLGDEARNTIDVTPTRVE